MDYQTPVGLRPPSVSPTNDSSIPIIRAFSIFLYLLALYCDYQGGWWASEGPMPIGIASPRQDYRPPRTLAPKPTATARRAAVAFHASTYGINVAGTVYRMDDVPIPLRPAFESPLPSDLEILRRIERLVRPGVGG